jgi:hypothetical protein
MAGALVAPPACLQQEPNPAGDAGLRCCLYRRLHVHAPAVAAVSAPGGRKGRLGPGHKSTSLRGFDVICPCLDPRSGARVTRLSPVRDLAFRHNSAAQVLTPRRSSPLPPISRIEEKGQARRCQRLRKNLRAAYADIVPILAEQCRNLKQLIQEDDLEKYLDVYEISNPDMQEAALGYSESEFDDAETLKVLRILQYRLSILRRVYLCSLLAMEADGGKPDFARWSTVVDSMLNTARPVGEWSEKFNRVLAEEEQFVLPSPAKVAPTPARDKIRNSVRKLSGLSSGIRGLQAKMQVLREETNKSLEDTEDVTDLGHSLLAQYDSIGADLKSLVQAWEAGKNALALNIDRHERRISQASSGLRSPVPSLGGLTAVDEGSPSDALRALNGDLLSPHQSAPSSDQGSTSDDEVFEAIALPKTRATMSREERMQKIQDDRARQASLREQRDASTNMLRELESVINLRPHRVSAPPAGARVTSL